MPFGNVGKVWSKDQFKAMLGVTKRPSWIKGVTLHHTASPSLAMRPKGLTAVHIENIASFYRDQLGWSGGPHFFIDEDQVWGMNDLSVPGVHAVSFNHTHLGIEVLGDFDSEDPKSGRGLECWQTAFSATYSLLDWLGLPINESTVKFHRDDPKTKKSCPGRLVKKDWVLAGIRNSQITPAPAPDQWMIEVNGEPFCHASPAQDGLIYVPVRGIVSAIGGKSLADTLTWKNGLATVNGKEIAKAHLSGDNMTLVAPLREICRVIPANIEAVTSARLARVFAVRGSQG